jgi:hypothetical protein
MNAEKAFARILDLLSGVERNLYDEDIRRVWEVLDAEVVLRFELRALVTRCDGAEGVQPDGSNMDTSSAHAALGDFDEEGEE